MNATPSTGYLVWRLLLKWRSELDRALAPLRITSSQYALLASLHGFLRTGKQPSQRELADFSGLEPMYVSKLARVLERAGLLERGDHRQDPRAFQLTLTSHGEEIVLLGVETVRRLEEYRLAPLDGVKSERSVQFRETLETLLRQPDAAETKPAPRQKPVKRAPARTRRKP